MTRHQRVRQAHRGRGGWIAVFGFGLTALAWAAPANATTAQQVQQAIDKAQQYLLTHREKNGTWEVAAAPQVGTPQQMFLNFKGRQWGGFTAIATYALLASGKDYRDDDLKPAINFLLQANIQSTYGVGLSSQIALYLPEAQTRTLVKRNEMVLLNGMIQPQPGLVKRPAMWPPEAGFYGYWTGVANGTNQAMFSLDARSIGTHQPLDHYDRSNSQYAVLGMWALEQAGAEIPALYWEIVDAAWKKAELANGSWNYREGEEPRPSMTAAGVATLFITQDYTLNENWAVCRGGVSNPFIERGLQWMDNHVNEALDGNVYTMYGVERIGTASGRKYFGSRDWYDIGADYLVKHQQDDGSWPYAQGGPVPGTSFGLLFLARGRAPVLMNKLQYTTESGERGSSDRAAPEMWDERPRDVANLARWVGKQEETYFNWQVVSLQAQPEDLHDAPILYISGAQALNFSDEDKAKLRRFVDEGGMILANADCAQQRFSASVVKLGKELFPKYEFRQVPANDLIWHEQFSQWRVKPRVMELNNGVRKLMLLIPDSDPARAWQTRSDRTREAMYQLGANIFLYAVDKRNLLLRGETYIAKLDRSIKAAKSIKVARLDVGPNPDPEPGGWPRLAAILHNRNKLDLQVDLVKPEALAPSTGSGQAGYQIADLTGTGTLSLSEAQRAALKQFVESGGTLIVDAAGGDREFAGAAEAQLEAIFPGGKFGQIPVTDPLYTQPLNAPVAPQATDEATAADATRPSTQPATQPQMLLEKPGWRAFAIERLPDRKHFRLEGLAVGRRIGVFFSREDLSAGLVGEPVDGVNGYDPKTATDLMAAMMLYAAKQ